MKKCEWTRCRRLGVAKKNCMILISAGNTYNKKGGGQHQYTEETVAGAGKERACQTALAELLQSGSV